MAKAKKTTFGAKVDKGIGTVKYLTSKETVTGFAQKNKNIIIALLDFLFGVARFFLYAKRINLHIIKRTEIYWQSY